MIRSLFLFAVALSIFACSGGPGSETTNGIFASSRSVCSPYATVALRKIDFRAQVAEPENALIHADTYADKNGHFEINILDDGAYRLTVMQNNYAFTKIVYAKDINSMDSIELVETAIIDGSVNISQKSFVWVGILGTDILTKTDSLGNFTLQAIPANDTLSLYFMSEDYSTDLGEVSIYLKPSEIAEFNYRNTDTIPTKKVSILLDNGTPAKFATIALRKAKQVATNYVVQNAAVLPDIYSDSSGNFAMEWPTNGSYRLTVTSDAYVYSKIFNASELSKIDTITLKQSASLSSKVTLRSGYDFAWVGVYGLDVLVKTNSLGDYVLPNLPIEDSLSVYFAYSDTIFAKRDFNISSIGTVFINPVTVIQDFENNTSDWYLSIDTLKKGTVFKTANVESGIEYDATLKSKVFHGEYSLAADDYAWVLVGVNFDYPENFSEIDSVSFMAKGNGTIRLSLENWSESNASIKAASAWIELSDNWKKITLKPTDLCADALNLTNCFTSWNSVKNKVKQLHIFPHDGSEFYIDDITIYGALF